MPSVSEESWTGARRSWPTRGHAYDVHDKGARGEMCKLLAEQDPQRFKQTSRSLRISGQSTSVRLEAAFWEILDVIAAKEGMSVSRLLATLYDEALDIHGDISNFASLLRTICLIYQGERAEWAIRRHWPA